MHPNEGKVAQFRARAEDAEQVRAVETDVLDAEVLHEAEVRGELLPCRLVHLEHAPAKAEHEALDLV